MGNPDSQFFSQNIAKKIYALGRKKMAEGFAWSKNSSRGVTLLWFGYIFYDSIHHGFFISPTKVSFTLESKLTSNQEVIRESGIKNLSTRTIRESQLRC